MKVVEVREAFGLENLVVGERPEPKPGSREVVVEMRAASLNYRDYLMVSGHYDPKQPLPLIPCSDGVGEVAAVGSDVKRVAVGDRVATLFSQNYFSGEPTHDKLRATLGGPLDGALAERMALSEEGVIRVPDHLTDAEAACLPCAALTAWSALVTQASVGPGDTVVVLGTGGVALFALQFARLLGARVIVTSSSDEKLAKARELGASLGINYRETPRWGSAVRKATDGRGADLVIEVGGAGTLAQSLDAVRFGGQVSMIGVLSGVSSELSVIPVLMKNIRVQGILVGHREGFEAMNRAISEHELRPVIDHTAPFTEARSALEAMAEGKHFGKICLAF